MNHQPNPVDTIRRFIERERQMREYVFRNRPAELAKKVGECDQALRALDRLASQTGWVPVFDGRVDDHLHVRDGALFFEDELGEAQVQIPDGYAICYHRHHEPIDQPTLFQVD